MTRREELIPVYLVTGFLESGKTELIHSMLKDERFTAGQKTLVICCEEGEQEYDDALLKKRNAQVIMVEDESELTGKYLSELNKMAKPERVFIEYNSIWGLEKLGKISMPRGWQLVQVVTLADATTFDNYMQNMRKLLTDPMKEADLILVNRCKPEQNKSAIRRQLLAINPRCNILFENLDGTTENGVSDEDLPYDMKADVIYIAEEHLGIFYLDALDHPERYHERKVRFTAQHFFDVDMPRGYSLFGRMAMTCCADDIAPIGWPCLYKAKYSEGVYVEMTAECEAMMDGNRAILTLNEISSDKGKKPKEDLMIFG